MLCLSLLLPGKVGRIVRRVLFPIFSIVLLYAIIWIIIMKCVKFESTSQSVQGKNLVLTINVKNETFAGVEIRDMNIVNKDGEYVKKILYNFPVKVPRYSEKKMMMKFALDDYKKVETTVKTLYNQYTFKNNVDRPQR